LLSMPAGIQSAATFRNLSLSEELLQLAGLRSPRMSAATSSHNFPLPGITVNRLLTNYLSRIELWEPQQSQNIIIVPIITENQEEDYLTLTEALERRLATITEVNQSGQCPNVKVCNASEVPLLLVDGEELVGGRQNRMLNSSILLAGKSKTIVPVSCTEPGGWSYKSFAFADAGYVSPHKLRKVKSKSVAFALKSAMGHKSDQRAVWSAVHSVMRQYHVQSPTSALHDAVVAEAKELEKYVQTFRQIPNQKGLVVLVNGEVVGVDILSSAGAYHLLHPKFIKSNASHALSEPKPASAKRVREKVVSFFQTAKATTERVHQAVGFGEDHRFEGQTIGGSALWSMPK